MIAAKYAVWLGIAMQIQISRSPFGEIHIYLELVLDRCLHGSGGLDFQLGCLCE